MVEIKKYMPDDIIPQEELRAWRSKLKRVEAPNCPPEVKEFIAALAKKLEDFSQIGKYNTMISGYELQLSGVREMDGQKINGWDMYPMPVPHMIAVDHSLAMHRIFHRKGKQGLIDFVKVKVKGTEMERLLEILNVHVFHQEREEFKQVMADIDAAKKIDPLMQ